MPKSSDSADGFSICFVVVVSCLLTILCSTCVYACAREMSIHSPEGILFVVELGKEMRFFLRYLAEVGYQSPRHNSHSPVVDWANHGV